MKISVFYNHLIEAAEQNGTSVEIELSSAREAGVIAVEMSFDETRDARLVFEAGLRISSIYRLCDFCKENSDFRDGKELIDRASELHVSTVLVIPGFMESSDDVAAKERMTNGLRVVCDYAKERNITVTLEDFDDSAAPYSSADGLLWFTERVQGLKLTFDTGNFRYSAEDELEAFEKLKGYIVHLHCKDRALIPVTGGKALTALDGAKLYASPTGSGIIRMDEIIKRLLDSGYCGYYAIEHFDSPRQAEFIRESVAYLRKKATIRVTIWNEFRHEREYDGIRSVYPYGIHGCIADFLGAEQDICVSTAFLDAPQQGLSDRVLDNTDVLIWWGHGAHEELTDENVKRLQQRVLSGMGLIALHSAHHSRLMKALLGTSLNLSWRFGDRERVWCIEPSHPIAKGLPRSFELPHEEAYGEPFDIPKPDEVVFAGWFAGGEVFRSGCTFTRGSGRIFYFQPGHEEYPIYYDENVRRVVINAVRWAFNAYRGTIECTNPQPLEPLS